MSIDRRLPISDLGRTKALKAAKDKKDNPGAIGNILSAPTTTRLDAIELNYRNKNTALEAAKFALTNATPGKATAFADAQMFISHYYQVLNLGIRRGVYPAACRSFYQIDVNSEAIPPLATEADVLLYGGYVISGDAARVAAGGAAMSNPTAAQTATKFNAWNALQLAYSNLVDANDTAQENLALLNTEADAVIKKVWDEAETFFNEEDPGSMRANCAEWGVIYITVGNNKAVTIHVVNIDGTDGVGKLVSFDEGGTEATTNAQGKAVFNTTIEGPGNFSVDGVAFPPFDIQPDVAQEFTIQLV